MNGLTRKWVAPCWWKRSSAARVVAREQDEQGRGIGLDRVGDRAHRLLALGERAARVDHRHRGARGDEARLGILRPARGDRLPAGALGEPGQLVAMAEGEDEERGPHRRALAALLQPRQSPFVAPSRLAREGHMLNAGDDAQAVTMLTRPAASSDPAGNRNHRDAVATVPSNRLQQYIAATIDARPCRIGERASEASA